MIYRVKVGDRSFDVDIEDIHARPVKATVEGVSFEVWPEEDQEAEPAPRINSNGAKAKTPPPGQFPTHPPAFGKQPVQTTIALHEVRAPIPGVIVSVAVQPGEEVSAGQVLCVLEAMKMKNIIRSVRSGQIAAVKVAPGQTVNHQDILVEFRN